MQGFLDGRAETAGNRGNEGEDGEWRMEDGKDARESGSRLEQHHRFRHRAGLPHSKITAEEMKRVLDGRAEAAGDRGNEGEDGEWRMEDGSSQGLTASSGEASAGADGLADRTGGMESRPAGGEIGRASCRERV